MAELQGLLYGVFFVGGFFSCYFPMKWAFKVEKLKVIRQQERLEEDGIKAGDIDSVLREVTGDPNLGMEPPPVDHSGIGPVPPTPQEVGNWKRQTRKV